MRRMLRFLVLLPALAVGGCVDGQDEGVEEDEDIEELDVAAEVEEFDPIADVHSYASRSCEGPAASGRDACVPEDSPGAWYLSTDPADCCDIVVDCKLGWTNVPEACGCGCVIVGHSAPVGVRANP